MKKVYHLVDSYAQIHGWSFKVLPSSYAQINATPAHMQVESCNVNLQLPIGDTSECKGNLLVNLKILARLKFEA